MGLRVVGFCLASESRADPTCTRYGKLIQPVSSGVLNRHGLGRNMRLRLSQCWQLLLAAACPTLAHASSNHGSSASEFGSCQSVSLLGLSQALSPKFQGGGLPCGPVCFDSHNCGKVHRLAHESKKEEHAWSGVFWSEVEHDSAGLDWTRF